MSSISLQAYVLHVVHLQLSSVVNLALSLSSYVAQSGQLA